MQKALEYKDRLAEKEQLLIEANLYSMSGATYDRAIETYNNLLEIYPDDLLARHTLAYYYNAIEDRQKAIEHYELCIKEYRTQSMSTYVNLATVY
jgi:tetratricopeptide (TPR) repeat protein